MKTKLLGIIAIAGFISYTDEQVGADACFILHKQKRLPRKPVWGLEFYYSILKKQE